MGGNRKKNLKIFCVVIIHTLLLFVIIGYNKRNVTTYNSEKITQDGKTVITEIRSVEDYFAFAKSVAEDNNYKYYTVTLYEDLDFSNVEEFPVIGATENMDDDYAFAGVFDGNGHVISGISVDTPDKAAGLFAKLDGIVKNLRIENSDFHGAFCGAIAAENYEGAVLNCYVDVVVNGDIAGNAVGLNYDGTIVNCVSKSDIAGQNLYGEVSHCYFADSVDLEDLNRNLYIVSGTYRNADFCRWEYTEDGILSRKKADLLETLTARITVDGHEVKINGYYAENTAKWCFALPAGYGDADLYLEAHTSRGGYEFFKRRNGEEEILFTWGEYYYPIQFMTAENITTLYMMLGQNRELIDIHKDKTNRVPGRMMIIDENGQVTYEIVSGFYGHGNDSWEAAKKSYNVKFDSRIDLLGMGKNEDFALLAGFRNNSLMSYGVTAELAEEVGFAFAPEFRFVNLYVAGEYVGVYFLTEKVEIDENRLDIGNIYEETKKVNNKRLDTFEHITWSNKQTQERRHYYNVEKNPEDITGGYLLELDIADYEEYESRFTTKNKVNKIVLKRAAYSSEEQVNYIADYWQDFESALLSETGCNEKGKRYTEYIDLESFVKQWLIYELSQEDSVYSSIYYYKESDVLGDGLLHACYPWDMERSYMKIEGSDQFGNINQKSTYWGAFYKHEDFKQKAAELWNEKFVPTILVMTDENAIETESGSRNLSWYQNYLIEINSLENSRWVSVNMQEKCGLIRTILEVRKDVIAKELESF